MKTKVLLLFCSLFSLLFCTSMSFAADNAQRLQNKIAQFEAENQHHPVVTDQSNLYDGVFIYQNQNSILTTIRETNDLFLWALLPNYYYDYEIDSVGTELGVDIDYRPNDDVFAVLGAFHGLWVDRPVTSLEDYKNDFISTAKIISGSDYVEILNEKSTKLGVECWNFCYESSGSIIWNSQLFIKDGVAFNLYYLTQKTFYQDPLQKLYFDLVLELFLLNPTPLKVNHEYPAISKNFSLMQNYPNPFNSNTKIRFVINKSSNVSLDIYNTNGQHVKNIINDFYAPGTFDVNVNFDGLSSGVYYYRVKNADEILSKKMIYTK